MIIRINIHTLSQFANECLSKYIRAPKCSTDQLELSFHVESLGVKGCSEIVSGVGMAIPSSMVATPIMLRA